jgi:hypothetical protein
MMPTLSDGTPVVPEETPEQAAVMEVLVGVVHKLKQREAYRDLVEAVQQALHLRLADAGFTKLECLETQTELANWAHLYVVRAASNWTHPDCRVPFKVVVRLTVVAGKVSCGEVRLDINLVDQRQDDGPTGVLVSRPFMGRRYLARDRAFDSVEAWVSWVDQALEKLQPSVLTEFLDKAVAFLEKASTP